MLELLTTINILEVISGICLIVLTFFALKNWKQLFSIKYMKTLDSNGYLNNAKFGRKYFVFIFIWRMLENAILILKNDFGWWAITVTCVVILSIIIDIFVIYIIKDEIKSEIDDKNTATTTISMMTKIKDTESKYDI
jgi:hypothetical protein